MILSFLFRVSRELQISISAKVIEKHFQIAGILRLLISKDEIPDGSSTSDILASGWRLRRKWWIGPIDSVHDMINFIKSPGNSDIRSSVGESFTRPEFNL
ncbi:hypothetical protein QCE73_25010 [Caballeronia sp. LZ029]|uniref:hypothetical protein n=1 Tax=Caballeronia sp. LZ029 TaxID=3038564 RepID=UPI0028559F40|nr:hypothetical protein [Caballeronia sp. LZ029]MDR5746436.1 hypothetical protein [Caballeronia sp. LZ029]